MSTMKFERILLPQDRHGLGGTGRILIDAHGVPHLYAATDSDLFFLQGFNAARDRLWQIDLWYKRGLGRLAADFGEAFLPHDIAARKMLYRADMDAEWAAYGSDARPIFTAFVDGVNAYVALVRAGKQPLPLEFRHFGTAPGFWAPDEAITIRFHGLTQNVENEVARARLRADGHGACERFLGRLQPPVDDTTSFTRDEADLLEKALAVYRRAVDPISFERVTAGWRDDPGGSNAWAIAGCRTPSGKPILASDPHRALTTPSLRYIVGLHAPGIDLVGGGEPMQPGVSIGHNGKAAFGLTIFPVDQEDLVLLDCSGEDEGSIERVDEIIQVKGRSQPVEARLDMTPVGPVLAYDASRRKAVALQSVWFMPGSFPYLQSLRYRNARSLSEFSAAAARWGCPAVNLVYADQQGDIAKLSTGFIPRRRRTGLVPRRGIEQAGWDGTISVCEFTTQVNPASGYVQTANEFNLPDGSIRDMMSGFEWSESSRSQRIGACLDDGRVISTTDALALQTDKKSLIAACVLTFVKANAAGSPEMEWLLAWDGVLDPESREAALFEIWYARHLKPALVALVAEQDFSIPRIDNEALCDCLEQMGCSAAPLLAQTFRAAIDELSFHDGRLGKETVWGDLHHAVFAHPLAGQDKSFPVVGPFRQGGSESTVFHSAFDVSTFTKTIGSTFRVVIDLADLDKSVCINAPGQSGDTRSPFYDAMAPLWAAGQVVHLVTSEAAVRKAAVMEIEVIPHKQAGD